MSNTLLNQALTKVYIAASSLAIIFWSLRVIRNVGRERFIAAFGCLVGVASLLGLASGHLRLNVHGFGLLILGQTIWTILTAVYLFTASDSPLYNRQDFAGDER